MPGGQKLLVPFTSRFDSAPVDCSTSEDLELEFTAATTRMSMLFERSASVQALARPRLMSSRVPNSCTRSAQPSPSRVSTTSGIGRSTLDWKSASSELLASTQAANSS